MEEEFIKPISMQLSLIFTLFETGISAYRYNNFLSWLHVFSLLQDLDVRKQ